MKSLDIGVQTIDQPSKFLSSNVRYLNNWTLFFQSVIERMLRKLAGWKTNFISQGGQFTLTRSIISDISLYSFSLVKVSKTIEDDDERQKRLHIYSWGHLCKPCRLLLCKKAWQILAKPLPLA